MPGEIIKILSDGACLLPSALSVSVLYLDLRAARWLRFENKRYPCMRRLVFLSSLNEYSPLHPPSTTYLPLSIPPPLTTSPHSA